MTDRVLKTRRVGEDTDEEMTGGLDELRKSAMMAHLLDALERGADIGHYGRLVFAMVARHFLTEDELLEWLQKDSDFSEAQARSLVLQVQGRDYNPPKRARILEWQKEQEFPICPDADNPDACNVYKDLKFPEGVYESISEYYEEKTQG
jgi:DNA primase large subunit